jgi:hypothetical protein
VDRDGQGKTVPGRFRLVSKVDNGKYGQERISKNNVLVPLLGTISTEKPAPVIGCGFFISIPLQAQARSG